MTKLFITRGLPGCGKSTWARKWVTEDPHHRAEVNRDAIRIMLHSVAWSGDAALETQVTVAQHTTIRELLNRGIDVVSSDTNLRQRYVRELASIARRCGAGVEIIDMTDVPLHTCIARDEARGASGDRMVGERAIVDMYQRFIASQPYPLPIRPDDQYHGVPNLVKVDPDLPWAVLCDIDGTVALKGARNPHDETRVHEDRPNLGVIRIAESLNAVGYPIIFMSGRKETCREATVRWLADHIPWSVGCLLYMREAGDNRKDSIVKRELFDRHIRGRYNVAAVLDDRDQVVKMWREELGLTCLQVAEGSF